MNDKNDGNRSEHETHGIDSGHPEPPVRWSAEDAGRHVETPKPNASNDDSVAGTGAIGKLRFPLRSPDEIVDLESARRYTMISQVVAVISLFFGGALLSVVAVVFAFAAYGKLDKLAIAHPNEPDIQRALRRSGYLVIGLSIVVLVLNIIAVVFLQPILIEALQSGTFGSLGGVSSPSGAGSVNVTWG